MALFFVLIIISAVGAVALFIFLLNIPEFLRQCRANNAIPTPISELSTTQSEEMPFIRGTIRSETPRLHEWKNFTEVVWWNLVVNEQVGSRHLCVLNWIETVPFELEDGSGAPITIIADEATTGNIKVTNLKWRDLNAEQLDDINATASFHWERTPRTCIESVLRPGDTVTVRGHVHGEAGSMHMKAINLTAFADSIWRLEAGRIMALSAITTVAGASALLILLLKAGVI